MRLSFIIPCYRAEKYIQQCLDSIFSIDMSETDYEIICFDDCPDDNTSVVLRRNQVVHDNLHIITEGKNVGPGAGRNRALNVARGSYIWFVDADDMINNNHVLDLLYQAETNDLDVLAFNYENIDDVGRSLSCSIVFDNTEVIDGKSFSKSAILTGSIQDNMGYPWRFISKNNYLQDISLLFPENIIYGEDTIWMPKLILWAKRIKGVRTVAYKYRHHLGSTCGQFDHFYPGKTIYERCIVANNLLCDFVGDVERKYDVSVSNPFFEYACRHYIGNLTILLLRTNKHERHIFYKLYFKNHNEVKNNTFLTSVLLIPYFGELLSNIMSYIYSVLK